jgi:hypothetical protein
MRKDAKYAVIRSRGPSAAPVGSDEDRTADVGPDGGFEIDTGGRESRPEPPRRRRRGADRVRVEHGERAEVDGQRVRALVSRVRRGLRRALDRLLEMAVGHAGVYCVQHDPRVLRAGRDRLAVARASGLRGTSRDRHAVRHSMPCDDGSEAVRPRLARDAMSLQSHRVVSRVDLQRVRARRGLYVQAGLCTLVASALIVTGTLTPEGRSFAWPLFGWGLGLAILTLVVLGGRVLDEQIAENGTRRHPDRGQRWGGSGARGTTW